MRAQTSSVAFVVVVAPAIKRLLGGGEFHSIEDRRAPEDFMAGIDAYQVLEDAGCPRMRGIAYRSNFGDNVARRNFTIRYGVGSGRATEFQKCMSALTRRGDMDQWLRPQIHVQAGIGPDGKIVNGAAVRTDRLFAYIKQRGEPSFGVNSSGYYLCRPGDEPATTLLAISWALLEREGVPVCRFDGATQADLFRGAFPDFVPSFSRPALEEQR